MKLFDVYPLYDINPVKAKGLELWDGQGEKYMDFYGGHAVISIGHSHPHYIKRITDQLGKIAFYSNSVQNPLQEALAQKLGALSGCGDHQLFLCNSGAEANENALKLASFHTGKAGVIAFRGSFHGRTSAAVAATDDPAINAPINRQHKVDFLAFDDFVAFGDTIDRGEHCAVILESIQGVGGLEAPSGEFYRFIEKKCREKGVLLIADEVQCGYGRSGKFFAFQHHGIRPDIISMAKGMGNGFPIGGLLIRPELKPSHGLLGTTFGGNHLACAAALAVLEVMEGEDLVRRAESLGAYFQELAAQIPAIKKVKGRGLMIGLEFDFEVAELRKKLIFGQRMFTGNAKNKKLLRFLPALTIEKQQIDLFFEGLKRALA